MKYEDVKKVYKEADLLETQANIIIKDLIGFFQKINSINKNFDFLGKNFACYLDSKYLAEQLMVLKDVSEEKVKNFNEAFDIIEDLSQKSLKLNSQLKHVEILDNETPQKFKFTLVMKKTNNPDQDRLFYTTTYPFVNMLNNQLSLDLDYNYQKYEKTKEKFNINFSIYSHLFYLLHNCFIIRTDDNLNSFQFNKSDFIKFAESPYEDVKIAMSEFNEKVSFHNEVSIKIIKGAFDDMQTIYNYLNDEVCKVVKHIKQLTNL